MASPQTEDGHIRIANELWDAWMRADLSRRDDKVIKAVLRRTYGFNKKDDFISIYWIAQVTNLHHSHAAKTVQDLIERKILVSGADKIHRGQEVQSLGINKDYDQWQPSTNRTRYKSYEVQTVPGNKVRTVPDDQVQTVHIVQKQKDRKTNIAHRQRRISRTSTPDIFPMTAAMIDYAGKLGVTNQVLLVDETEKFLLHHRAKGSQFSNWYAAWQTWIRNFVNPPWGAGKPRGHLRCDKSWMEDR